MATFDIYNKSSYIDTSVSSKIDMYNHPVNYIYSRVLFSSWKHHMNRG
jgi:hypothetical protein